MAVATGTQKVKVTFGSRYRAEDVLNAEGNITLESGHFLWKARQSHFGMGWDVEIDDNGKIPVADAEFIKAAVGSSIDDNIVEAVYRIPRKTGG